MDRYFLDGRPASAAAVAAAVDWAVAAGADLIHMSLGLAADRAVLGAAVQRAVELGRIIVAAAPRARGDGVSRGLRRRAARHRRCALRSR